MLQGAVISLLLVALTGCGPVRTIGDAHDTGSDPGEAPESDGETPPTTLDETLAAYANEISGEWYGMSLIDSTRFKATLSPSSTQPRTGSAEYELDCPTGGCPPGADGGRPRMTGPGWDGEYWVLRLKGPNAEIVMDLPFEAPVAPICTYMPAMKKLDCGLTVFSRTRAP